MTRRSFGTIELRGDWWMIRCEPHVRLWIKRLFPKASRLSNDGKGLTVSATVERTADLEWVCQRYPMDILDIKPWRERLMVHETRQAAMDELGEVNYVPPLFDGLALPPREYQRVAADLFIRTKGLLLADELGLGKTVSALAALTERRLLPALVVTMAHLTPQWLREAARFLPGYRVHVLKTARTTYDLAKIDKSGSWPDIIVSNYHKLDGWTERLAGKVKSVVFDECQELRRDGTKKYDAARTIASEADARLGLSATPVYNYGSEIYNLYEVLSPGMLGTRSEFTEEWCGGNEAADPRRGVPVKDPIALGSYLRSQGAMLLRTRKDVGRELPALTTVIQPTEADLSKLDAVQDRAAELARILTDGIELTSEDRFAASAELDVRMRQATGLAKAPFVAEFVRLLVDNGERVVLGGWHHAVHDLWMEKLGDLNPVRFTGNESGPQKEAALKLFKGGQSKVLIMSLRAGAGVDGLQHGCRTVVFGELDWSPAVHEQFGGRLHRDGQTEPVVVYYCVAESGSDPVVAGVLGIKETQSQGLRGNSGRLFGEVDGSRDHIEKLARSVLARRKVA